MVIDSEAGSTQAMRRRANQWMWESLSAGGYEGSIAFFCECGEEGCYGPVWLTAAEYAAARGDVNWSVLMAEHRPRGIMAA